MAIRVQCSNPQCRKSLDCPDEHAGKTVKCPACGTALQVPTSGQASAKPQMLGDYQLVRKLGQGGMGAVYEAVQTKLDRKVALKVLPQKFTSDSTFLERFQREAKAAAALNHPNIIQVHDIGKAGGIHFFAMELVDGESAQDRLKREGKLALEWALHIVRGAAEALRYAHQHQIIHRDIKPDNIMLTKEGQVKLADLGLAKKVGGDTVGVTQTGAGMGTPYYMAPEQAEDARSVDHRADIYALGITLLHLLTGKRPFEGESAYNIVFAHVQKPLPTGEQLGTPLPAAVEAAIRKMAAKDPNERYQDYDSLIADLEAAEQGKETGVGAGAGAGPEAEKTERPTSNVQHPTPKVKSVAAEGDGGPRGRATRPSRHKKLSKSRMPVFVGVAAVVALVGVGIFFAVRGGRRAERSSGTLSGDSSSSAAADASRQKTDAGKDSGATAPARQKTDAGRDSGLPAAAQAGATANLAAMLAYAENYAQENPEDYAEIIHKYELVKQKSEASVGGMKAADAIKNWQKKWEGAAGAELEKRRASAAEALKGWQFPEAEAVWEAFPKRLRVASIEPKIKAEQARIEEARNGVAKALEDEAKPLLARKSEELSAEEARAVSSLLGKAEDAPEGLREEAAQAIEALAEKLQALLDEYRAVAASKAQEAFEGFWAKYESYMKRKAFDEALKLCESAEAELPA